MMNLDHYYGDILRRLFIIAGIFMLVMLPFLQSFIPFSLYISILAILIIIVCAGFIAPPQRPFMIFDMVVAIAALVVFEYYAVQSYWSGNYLFFASNEVLAIIFFAASYYAVKTVRGAFIKHHAEGDDFAQDMLRTRYAKGEMNSEEFKEKMKQLEK